MGGSSKADFIVCVLKNSVEADFRLVLCFLAQVGGSVVMILTVSPFPLGVHVIASLIFCDWSHPSGHFLMNFSVSSSTGLLMSGPLKLVPNWPPTENVHGVDVSIHGCFTESQANVLGRSIVSEIYKMARKQRMIQAMYFSRQTTR